MKKKNLIIATTVGSIAGVAGYLVGKKQKHSSTSAAFIRPIEPVKASDVGFEEYGYEKTFDIDRSCPISILITGAGSYIGESFRSYCESHYPNIDIDVLDMQDSNWREHSFCTADGKPYNCIFHVAGIAHADVGHASAEEQGRYYSINTDLAIECAEKAKNVGCRQFIFMSSMIVYGGTERVDEHTVPCLANFYGNSKWLADKGVRELNDGNFAVAVLRPPMIYGKGSKGNYSILSRIAKAAPVFPMVDNKRSMLYIENLCEFVAQLSLSGSGGIFFPQNREYSNTSEIVRLIGEVAGSKVRLSKALAPAVALVAHMPNKKIQGLAEKAFGSSWYEAELSKYKGLEYQLVDLRTSIQRTEG